MLKECLENVRKKAPLVHNITNYVTVNDVANILLACGGSPIIDVYKRQQCNIVRALHRLPVWEELPEL